MKTKETTTMEDSALHELFIDELKDIYWAEKHLVKNLPKMVKAATSSELKNAIQKHLKETEGHVTRLEQVFEVLGQKASAKKCEAMDGLVKEAQEMVDETEDGSLVRDVAIISCAQKVEHYEIATYGTLCTLAKVMGHTDAGEILAQTLARYFIGTFSIYKALQDKWYHYSNMDKHFFFYSEL